MNYIILSSGAYSDYDPVYYVGERKITQEELEKKSLEIGDKMWEIWESYPTKVVPHMLSSYPPYKGKTQVDRYDPNDPKRYIDNSGPDDDEFMEKMEDWLNSVGYKKVPQRVPEINVYYDVPRTT